LIQINAGRGVDPARFRRNEWASGMTRFTTGPLADNEVRAVFPLLREVIPTLTLPAWLGFVRQLAAVRPVGHAGIVVARRVGRAFPCGLFCYRILQDLERGRVLVADHFVAVDLLDPGAVLQVLVRELEAVGARFGCSAIRGVVAGEQPELAVGLSAAGHTMEASLFGRSLSPCLERGSPGMAAT
jgi:hypothetical protein